MNNSGKIKKISIAVLIVLMTLSVFAVNSQFAEAVASEWNKALRSEGDCGMEYAAFVFFFYNYF